MIRFNNKRQNKNDIDYGDFLNALATMLGGEVIPREETKTE